MNNNQSLYFPQLTGVRAIAAYMVFIHHFNFLNPRYFGNICFGMANELHIGVTFFFVLSGFLIAYKYSHIQSFHFGQYITNRIARIYPVYFALTILTFISYNSFSNKDWIILFLNVSFLRGFFEDFKFSLVAQGWSLTVEETFYLLAPICFLFLNKSKVAFILIPTIFIMLGVLINLIFKDCNLYGFFEGLEFVFNYTFFGRVFEFTAGILLAYILKSNIQLPKTSLQFGVIICVLSVFTLFKLQHNGEYDYGIRTNTGKIINTLILPFFGIIPLYYGLITRISLFSKLLSSSIFQILGKSSYVFYLIHMGVLHSIVVNYLSNNIMITFLIIQLVSILIWRFFEEPMNRFIRRSIIFPG
jgi:peptidoglycan/LPS O-acetylase OafA/YrhL